MPFIQFRIHPSVGIARMGDSPDVYYLAPEVPQYLQEEIPALRFKPRHRTKPPVAPAAEATANGFKVFDDEKSAPNRKAEDNKYKDKPNKRVIPQAARFRVFAYVYDRADKPHPSKVFEVTTDEAEIKWSVKLANLKGEQHAPRQIRKSANETAVELDTADPKFRSTEIKNDVANPPTTPPRLGYAFLERKKGAEAQVNGRLHLIGNEGDIADYNTGSSFTNRFSSLWFEDWYDSQADGPVEAEISPKDALFQKAGVDAANKADLKSLSFGTEAPTATDGGKIKAVPAWAVVGLPNYTPDMGHFVSVWDLGLSNAINSVVTANIKDDLSHHKLIREVKSVGTYQEMDYRVHIHPQLCLFRDVNWVSGASARDPGHDVTSMGTADPTGSVAGQIEKGGIRINPRDDPDPAKATWPKKKELADRSALKDASATKPINEWVKVAIVDRLRPPDTLYLQQRKFFEEGAPTTKKKEFPRHLGRRADYDDKKAFGALERKGFPVSANTDLPDTQGVQNGLEKIPGNLKKYHTIIEKNNQRWCGNNGLPKFRKNQTHPAGYNDKALLHLDDMYWPINNKTMPLLRDLAYTHHQYNHFKIWCAKSGPGEADILQPILTGKMRTDLTASGPDHDPVIETVLQNSAAAKYAPSMIDMASMETMLGGSFLPGIEVGLEAGRRQNWSIYHGGNRHFADVRFERCLSTADQHFPGRLTKDLAIPWQVDFVACLEEYWPTSRPGVVHGIDPAPPHGPGPQKAWMIRSAGFPDLITYYSTYWKQLGFMRRQSDETILEDEKT